MDDPSVTIVKESKCLACGRKVNAVGNPEDLTRPVPGSLIVCMKCGAVMMLADDLTLRGMTDAEMDELMGDRETMDDLARLVKKVHLFRAHERAQGN